MAFFHNNAMTRLLALAVAGLLAAAPAGAQVEVSPRATLARSAPVAIVPSAALSLTPSLAAAPLSASPLAAPLLAPAAAPLAAPVLAPAPLAVSAAAPLSAAPIGPAALAPAAARSAEAASSPAKAGVGGRLAKAVSDGVSFVGSFFDGSRAAAPDSTPAFAFGFITRPHGDLSLNRGVGLDAKPRPREEGSVRVKDFHFAKDHALEGGAAPIALDAKAGDEASIEKALRALVDADPKKYGAGSADMAKVHVRFVPGDKAQGQADTYYAIFRQWKKGTEKNGSPYYLLVDGGSLTFVIKVLADGKPTIMATEGRLYPNVSPDVMTVNFTDAQLLGLAAKRMESPPDAMPGQLRRLLSSVWESVKKAAGVKAKGKSVPQFLTRQLTDVNGTWRAINIYQAEDLKGRPVIVAVDVKSGDAFAWSAQELLRDGGPIASGVAGAVLARGTTLSPTGSDHGPTGALPLPFANVYDQSGKTVARTADDGTFTVPGAGAAPVKLTIRLEGAYAKTTDDDAAKNGPVEVTVMAKPGETVKATLNPTGDSEELAAEVNGYVYYSKQVDWLKNAAGVVDERIQAPLGGGIKANRHDMPGNAYYSPADDSLNLQAAATVKFKDKKGVVHSIAFENTAQPSIIYHESTHRAVQILSQIALSAEQAADAAYRFVAFVMDPVMDGGVNEAIADTVSMFMRGNPLIGEGFYVTPPKKGPNLIRTGENDTVLDPKDPDPHAQGEAFMGFTWNVRQGLVSALGEAAGAAYAALLVVPTTLYSQPKDVPTAMLHVLLSDMKTDGSLPHESLIRAAAKAHGPELPNVPAAK